MMERIDAASDRAVYRQIADHLRRDIIAGTIAPGEQLPRKVNLSTGTTLVG